MSIKPDFTTMTATELRAYVLEHRDEEESLHAYLDKLHTKKENSQVYKLNDNVADEIAKYLKTKT